MEKTGVLIVGAGVIGLAVAARLAERGREIIVVEQHDGFGRETSSRNSEVIHAGIYYGEDLLKTRLGVRGNRLLYELCGREGIAHRKCGKIIVATSDGETAEVQRLLDQGTKNGVSGLRLLSSREVSEMEPHAAGRIGLYSPDTGIIDSHQLMQYLERSAESKGATIAYHCTVTAIERAHTGYAVEIADADGEQLRMAAETVVNCAGLYADRVAGMAGVDVDAARYRTHYCKGEYFRISPRHRGKLSRLIYPPPSPTHLGTHATLSLDGSLRIGPNSIYIDTPDYDVDPAHRAGFFDEARGFLPFLELEDLSPDMSGIRPKLYRTGEPFRDFEIQEESERDLPGFVNLIGIESPGLTACLAIAEMVDGLI